MISLLSHKVSAMFPIRGNYNGNYKRLGFSGDAINFIARKATLSALKNALGIAASKST